MIRDCSEIDRRSGAMPSYIQKRDDGDALWNAFRQWHYLSWTGRDVAEFVRGWDANRAKAEQAQKALGWATRSNWIPTPDEVELARLALGLGEDS